MRKYILLFILLFCFSCEDNNELELIYSSITDEGIYNGNSGVLLKFSKEVSNDIFDDHASDEPEENIYFNDKNQETIELDASTDSNIEDSNIEYIKLDLNQDIKQNVEIVENDNIDNFNLEGVEENNNIFENPIFSSNDNDDIDENSIRKTNLKKYNYVFKNNNSSIEDLEKIPAYKRMGIEIDNSKQLSEDNYSKTVLNEENKLEFPDVNKYLNDNVD